MSQPSGRGNPPRRGGRFVECAKRGLEAGGYVHPLAIQVMKEIGVDISGHRSKHLDEFLKQPVETVITACGNADQACPMFPGQVNRHRWGFYDPAKAEGADEEKLAVFRRVRNEIKLAFEAYAAVGSKEAFVTTSPAFVGAIGVQKDLCRPDDRCVSIACCVPRGLLTSASAMCTVRGVGEA